MLIIFVNHIPNNEGQFFTPSRYGWSDAAEIFVFCSGFVSARVFGRGLDRSGLALGTVWIMQRCGQIYAVHLGLFAALALACLAGNAYFPGHDYIEQLNIRFFFEQTETALPALATLRYVPNGIDILPMYLVLLSWIPAFWALGRLHHGLAWAGSLGIYLAAWTFDLELSAQLDGDRAWFFNPFAWQLVFFAGYTLGAGWLKPRLGQPFWIKLSLAVVVLAIPFAHEASLRPLDWMSDLHGLVDPLYEKTRLGPLRLLHFAALAYLVTTLLDQHQDGLETPIAIKLRILGQHSLPIFAIGLLLARLSGMALDQTGHEPWSLLVINLGGLTLLVGIGLALDWLDNQTRAPDKRGDAPRSTPAISWRTPVTGGRILSLALLLLPLSVGPFLLPKKPVIDPLQSRIGQSLAATAENPPESSSADAI